MADVCMGEDFSEELTCAVCLDSWKYPVEIVPCGHIFCQGCVKSIKKCPVCRVDIASTKAPNRTLVNMAAQIQVKCAKCGWRGTREQSYNHKCGTTPAPAPSPSPQQQQQNFGQSSGGRTGGGYDYGFNGFSSGAPGGYNPQAPVGGASYMARPPQGGNVAGPPGGGLPAGRRYNVIPATGARPWTNYGIGQDEYDQIVSLFVFFDEDDSGALDRREVGRLARWLNFARTPQEVDRIFQDMDYDGDGSLALPEFLTWLKYNKPDPQSLYGLTQSQYNTVMMQFHTYDTNQDGCLEMNEFTRLVLTLGDVRDEATAQRLFRMIDKDRSGAIDLHEFLSFRAGRG